MRMAKENIFHYIIVLVVAGISAYLKIIAIPIIILIAVMIVDYATGLICAKKNAKLSSRIGIIGIVKKVCYLALVGVGATVDYILCTVSSQLGIESNAVMTFGVLVTVWLIINELISILENLSKIGVPMPNFLMKLVEKLKITVESKADTTTE